MVISFFTYRLLSFVIGILYPCYQTYKSLKYQIYDQYQPLLSYWIVFSLFQIYEFLFDPVISLVLPFYYEMKLFFVFWLTYKNIAELCLNHFLLVLIDKYESDIDYLLNNTVHRLTEFFFKSLVFILHQQRLFPTSTDSHRSKTNFASQYRRMNSIPRQGREWKTSRSLWVIVLERLNICTVKI